MATNYYKKAPIECIFMHTDLKADSKLLQNGPTMYNTLLFFAET